VKPKPTEPKVDPYVDSAWRPPLLLPYSSSSTPDEPQAYVVLQRELTKTQATSETKGEMVNEEKRSHLAGDEAMTDRPTAFGTAIILSPALAQPMPVVFQASASETGGISWDGQPQSQGFDAESRAKASRLEELGAMLTFGTKSIPTPSSALGLPPATLAAAPAARLPNAKLRSATTLGFTSDEDHSGVPPAIALHDDGMEMKIGRWAKVNGAVNQRNVGQATSTSFGGITIGRGSGPARTAIDMSGSRRGDEPDTVAFHGVVGSGQGISIVEEEEATAAAMAYDATKKQTYQDRDGDGEDDEFAAGSTLSQFGQLASKAGGKSNSRVCATPATVGDEDGGCIIA
jgi:hypothetical protein